MEATDEFTLRRWMIWCGTGILGLFFLLTATCGMQSNAFEPDVIRAKAELEKERLTIVKERLAAVERLVDKGIHPVIARCSITPAFKQDECRRLVSHLTELEATHHVNVVGKNNESK